MVKKNDYSSDLKKYLQSEFEDQLGEVFANGIEKPVFSMMELDNGRNLRIEINGNSFSMSGSNINIKGSLDDKFNVKSLKFSSVSVPVDGDYKQVLDRLKRTPLTGAKFMDARPEID